MQCEYLNGLIDVNALSRDVILTLFGVSNIYHRVRKLHCYKYETPMRLDRIHPAVTRAASVQRTTFHERPLFLVRLGSNPAGGLRSEPGSGQMRPLHQPCRATVTLEFDHVTTRMTLSI